MGDGRHGAPRRRSPGRRVVLAVIGVALLGYGLYSAVGSGRTLLEPKARVRLDCQVGQRDQSCPASWTVDGRTVRGTASDPYSGHRFSRFIDHSPNAVLTMHVSGDRATMPPDATSILISIGFPIWGLGMILGPFWYKLSSRRAANVRP
jgi:hypothetical protein